MINFKINNTKKKILNRLRNCEGFTLIELIVVIGIISIFSGIFLARYNENASQLKLRNEAKKLVDVLELAKKKALSADLFDKNCTNFTGYRVTIASGSYSLFFGCVSVYSTVQSYNLSSNMTVVTGTGNYNFSPLMNNPSFISNTIRLKNSVISKCLNISISPIGIIELNETLVSC